MKSSRRRARELVLQGLYQRFLSGNDAETIRQQLAESGGFAKCDVAFFDTLWSGVTREVDVLLDALAPYLDRPVRELSPVEKSILAIGAWELMRDVEVPYRVAINEAVELAKAYGGTDGHKYVNGVLDKLAGSVRSSEVSARRAAR